MRRMHRLFSSSGFGLALVTLLFASPAQAQTDVIVDGGALIEVTDTSVSITNAGAKNIMFESSALSENGQSCEPGCAINVGVTRIYDISPAANNETFWITNFDGNYQQMTVTYGSTASDGASSDETAASPAPHVQQFELPDSGNCDDAAPESMNWSGIPSGGWGISWAQWMNEGAGGAVCTRTVMYDTATAKWVVN